MKTPDTTSLLDIRAILSEAVKEHARWRGKIVNVCGAYVGNCRGDTYRVFDIPLQVHIKDAPLVADSLVPSDDQSGELVDTNFPAELHGSHPDISAREHVAYIDGPIFRPGATEMPAWMGARDGAPCG